MRTGKRRVSVEMIKALRDAKSEKGLTNRSVADEVNISYGQVGHIFRGHCTFVTENLQALANHLGVSLDDYKSGRRSKKKKTLWRKRKYRTVKSKRCNPLAKNADPNDILNSLIKAKVIEELEGLIERLKNNP